MDFPDASGRAAPYGCLVSRVLVAYGSKHGATAEIAEAIGEALRAEGHEAEVDAAGAVNDFEPYEAIVLGSAVYSGRWRRDARALLRQLGRGLGDRPLWVFSSGPVGEQEPDPASRWQYPNSVRKACERLGARDAVVFAGRVPLEPGNFIERSMVKNTPEDRRDCRDFEAIAAWARAIAGDLRAR